MPSAEETTYLFKVMPETTQEFISRDVDLLVSRIKENLRLSGFKAKSSVSQKNRPSPYRVPSRSWADPGNCEICSARSNNHNQHNHHHHHHLHHHHHHHLHHKRNATTRDDDPYELLQELLREGGLIKEAVKRLQTNLEDFEDNTEDEDDEEDDDDDEDDDDEDPEECSEERQRRRERQRQHRDSMGYRRKTYFYDSEDEPLPPSYEPLEL